MCYRSVHGRAAVPGAEVEDGAAVDEGHDHSAGAGPDAGDQRQWSLWNRSHCQHTP